MRRSTSARFLSPRPFTPVLFALLACDAASGQSALLREGDPAPNAVPGQFVAVPSRPSVNDSAGYACYYYAYDGVSEFSDGLYGAFDGGAPTSLRAAPGTVGGYEQLFLSPDFGLGSNSIAYQARVRPIGSSSEFGSVWLDDAIVAIAGDPVPGSTNVWNGAFRKVSITNDRDPVFVGDFADPQSASIVGSGLYRGSPPVVLYQTGVVYPNMPSPIDAQLMPSFSVYRFSQDGNHSIVPLIIESPIGGSFVTVAVDGAGLVLDGALVVTGTPVPASLGGAGESWSTVDVCGINGHGEYFFTGRWSGGSADSFIVRDGVVWHRDGDVVDGAELSGEVVDGFLSEDGELAYVWNVLRPSIGVEHALFLEDELLLRRGDAVDWDGDGTLDAVTLQRFRLSSSLRIATDRAIYFVADCDVNGTNRIAMLRIPPENLGTNYCQAVPNSSGFAASMRATGTLDVAQNDFRLLATDLPRNAFGYFLNSDQAGFVANPGGSTGNLCLGGSIGRFLQQVQNSGASGVIEIQVDLTAVPRSSGTVAVAPGQRLHFSAWFRDVAPAGGVTSNFADGLEVVFE
ncbi:MAG: hypothetical protein AAGI22_00290 [Planctomycetota bacterium]